MVKQRKLLFRVILFLIIIFSIGINTYSYLEIQPDSTEILTGTKNIEDSFNPDVDYLSFDQIDQSHGFDIVEESRTTIAEAETCFLIRTFSFSIWQPPKIF